MIKKFDFTSKVGYVVSMNNKLQYLYATQAFVSTRHRNALPLWNTKTNSFADCTSTTNNLECWAKNESEAREKFCRMVRRLQDKVQMRQNFLWKEGDTADFYLTQIWQKI